MDLKYELERAREELAQNRREIERRYGSWERMSELALNDLRADELRRDHFEMMRSVTQLEKAVALTT